MGGGGGGGATFQLLHESEWNMVSYFTSRLYFHEPKASNLWHNGKMTKMTVLCQHWNDWMIYCAYQNSTVVQAGNRCM